MSRLAGHDLYNEGAPYGGEKNRRRLNLMGTGGVGRGKCSCLAVSPILTSGNARKQWHREHKAEVQNASSGPAVT